MKKNVIILGMSLLMSTQCLAAEGDIIYSNGTVNVRQAPGMDSEIIGEMPYNSQGVILEEDEYGWIKIQSGNMIGYVASYYFTNTPVDNGYTVVENNAEMLYIRSYQSEDASIIGSLSYGDVAEVTSEYDGGAWVGVVTKDGLYGYVKADYVGLNTYYGTAQEITYEVPEEVEYYYDYNYEEPTYYEENYDYNYEEPSYYEKNNNNDYYYYEEPVAQEEITTSSSSSSRSGVSGTANQYVGSSYVWGGTSPSGFDCSGLAQYAYAQNGVSIPRTAASQYSGGTQISVESAVSTPGALIFYHDFGHVAVSNGDGTVTHASNPSSGVKVSDAYYSTPCGAAIY